MLRMPILKRPKRCQEMLPLLSLVAGLASCSAKHSDVSGTYIATRSNEADMLQIVEQPGGAILGRFETEALAHQGASTVARVGGTVSGAVNNDIVVMTIDFENDRTGASKSIQVSGTIHEGEIRLSGGGALGDFTLDLRRGDIQEFTQKVDGLTAAAAANHIQDQRIAMYAKDEAQVTKLTAWMTNYVKTSSAPLGELQPLPSRYRGVTQRMDDLLAKEQALPTGSYGRSTWDYNITSLSYTFSTMHNFLAIIEQNWNYSKGQINNPKVPEAIVHAEDFCAGQEDHGAQVDGNCINFERSLRGYNAAVSKLSNAFEDTENAWNTENAKQRLIVQRADALAK